MQIPLTVIGAIIFSTPMNWRGRLYVGMSLFAGTVFALTKAREQRNSNSSNGTKQRDAEALPRRPHTKHHVQAAAGPTNGTSHHHHRHGHHHTNGGAAYLNGGGSASAAPLAKDSGGAVAVNIQEA